MILGLISDTHDSLEIAVKAVEFFGKNQVDRIIHAGDWTTPNSLHSLEEKTRTHHLPLYGVLGNNDQELKTIKEEVNDFAPWAQITSQEVLEIKDGDKKIAVYHGQDHIILNALINSQTYDALIKGHSHRIEHMLVGKTYVINPGSAAKHLLRKKDLSPSIGVFNTSTWERSFYLFKNNSFQQVQVELT